MAADQLPDEVREFVDYLDGLLARLNPDGGWCAVFWRRDPEGMRACLDGREVPPWDVVEALLLDLAADYGAAVFGPERERARALHSAALTAYDDRPDGRHALGDRLDVMLRERRYAAERHAELGRLLAAATTREEADALHVDLAWAQDDHERATARCAELRDRMTDWDDREAEHRARQARTGAPAPGGYGRGPHGAGLGAADPRRVAHGEYGRGSHAAGAGAAGPAPAAGEGVRGVPGRAYGRGPHVGGSDAADPTLAAGQGLRGGTGGASAGPEGRSTRGPGGYAAPGSRPSATGAAGRAAAAAQGVWGDAPGAYTSAGSSAPHRASAVPEAAIHDFGAPEPLSRPDFRDAVAHSSPSSPPGAGVPVPGIGDAVPPSSPGASASAPPSPPGAGASVPGIGNNAQPPAPGVGTPVSPSPPGVAAPRRPAAGPGAEPVAEPPAADPGTAPAPAKQRKRRRGGARFAGMAVEEAGPVVVPQEPEAGLPAGRRVPRGARFAGVGEVAEPVETRGEAVDAEGRRAVAQTVAALVLLRGEGRTGEAHALLVEVAHWPAARLPALAAELQRAGLGADWTTLLWEAASLPADRLVGAADALVAAGRADDGQQILRQGVVRPAVEIGEAVRGLDGQGRRREVRALLDAYVRVRTPEEAARSAAPDPQRLVPLLLEAARGVSQERHWDLLHALRVAGFTA
ncbi:hypothetical protein [Streptomyces sp. NPDC054794]